ncbi:MAG TPA: PH domain-containing protein, partial [Jatrophihabitans sp.]|nr:PH domain-containing protein [Jatrophihabitans sp.]
MSTEFTAGPEHPAPADAARLPDARWRRLSPRMLLIHPVREVARFIPALFGIVLAGRNSGHDWWSLAALVFVVGLSLLRWFTTSYQITPAQVQLRTGLFRRRTMTAPADRVRTVDVTAHALHRVLGLARVTIGTGTSDRRKEGLVLDGLSTRAAGALRAELLHRQRTPATQPGTGGEWSTAPAAVEPAEELVARLDPSWIRYAPFTLSGAVTALAILGVAWRAFDQAQVDAGRLPGVRDAARHLQRTPLPLDVLQLALGLALVVVVLSVVGYVLAFWGFRLTRHAGGTLHISRGLITARNTSIEERRLRGIEISQLLPLRLVGGARLLALATGLRVGRGAERGGTLLLPAAPAPVVAGVAAAVLPDPGLPVQASLTGHGRRARRRRYLRATVP